MRKLSIKPILSVVLSIAFLYACEGGTTFTKTINNQSSDTISFKLFHARTDKFVETRTICPNQSAEIYNDYRERKFVGDSYECIEEYDTIKPKVFSGKSLKKDIMNADNWVKDSKGGRKSREDCTFTVRSKDIQ